MTVLEGIVLTIKAKALAGNAVAGRLFEKLSGTDLTVVEPGVAKGVFFCSEEVTHEEWLAKYGTDSA